MSADSNKTSSRLTQTIEARWRQDRRKHRSFKQQVFNDLAEVFARRFDGERIEKKVATCAKRLVMRVARKIRSTDRTHEVQVTQGATIYDFPTELVQDIWLRSGNECLPFASHALAQRLRNWRSRDKSEV